MKEARSKAKAVVVGGSIAGLSCAHALIAAGWDVVVLEKTSSLLTGCATGAGLGLDQLSQKLLESWIKNLFRYLRCRSPLIMQVKFLQE